MSTPRGNYRWRAVLRDGSTVEEGEGRDHRSILTVADADVVALELVPVVAVPLNCPACGGTATVAWTCPCGAAHPVTAPFIRFDVDGRAHQTGWRKFWTRSVALDPATGASTPLPDVDSLYLDGVYLYIYHDGSLRVTTHPEP